MRLLKNFVYLLMAVGLLAGGATVASAVGTVSADAPGGGTSVGTPMMPEAYCVDVDGDTYYVGFPGPANCSLAPHYPLLDCNDNNAAVNPGATEVCNGVDDDCDSAIDEGVLNTYWLDADNDTYGDLANPLQTCAGSPPPGFRANSTDCNDSNAGINPGALDTNCNAVDENCSGLRTRAMSRCRQPAASAAAPAPDRPPASAAWCWTVAWRGARTEICANTVDDDCDGFTDEAGPRYVDDTGGSDVLNDCLAAGTPCATIQHGIDVACVGETVNVAAGTYTENVIVNKTVTVQGAGEGSTTVYPLSNAPNCGGLCSNPSAGGSLCAGSSNIFLVQANSVTLAGMTLDGDNPEHPAAAPCTAPT